MTLNILENKIFKVVFENRSKIILISFMLTILSNYVLHSDQIQYFLFGHYKAELF